MEIYIIMFAVASALYVIRALRGPTFADRYLGISTVTSIVAMVMVSMSFSPGREFFLDIAILLVMLSFVGSLAIARFGTKGAMKC